MMDSLYIREIIPVGKNRYKIICDQDSPFVLYKGELLCYGIQADHTLSGEDYEEICSQILSRRAKLRAMHLLEKMDYTTMQMKRKLADYPPHIVDETMLFLAEHNYINDERYVENYISFRGDRMSRREIKTKLLEKGVSSALIETCLEEYEGTPEKELIAGWIQKKKYDPKTADEKQKRRMMAFLMRKGFAYSDICEYL